ncbi:MAG TPA: ATP synthase F1 subunit delta [Bacteroidia bacterium]|nr:ATP synthase F1 subunit delta [Bacteroidia bacterium]
MVETKVSKRYAKSLIELAQERGVTDTVQADMKLFADTCAQNRDLSLLLSNPIIQSDKKMEILRKIFGGKMNALSISFFEIVTRKSREAYLEHIAKSYITLYKTQKGILTAEVTSAIGLDENLRKKVYAMVSNSGKSEVELIEKIDPKLIGGFVLRIGDKQYDASISAELRKLAKEFSSNPYVRKN